MFSFATIGRNILVLVLLAIIIFTGIINPRFLSLQNILNILQQISVLGIVSIGMTILLISGGLDLSVGVLFLLVLMSVVLLLFKLILWVWVFLPSLPASFLDF